jgi:uncharacterized Fe-S cluster protein YjdI
MDNPNDREYSNGEITVFWKPSKCIHATTCFRELIDVYNPRKRPWVNMNGASTERIIEVTDKCPTQAIYWKYNKDLDYVPGSVQSTEEELNPLTVKESKSEENAAKITLMKNGPMLVEGNFKIISAEGDELKPMIITSFCRCGNSKAQPYCDGTHRQVGFSG